VVGYEEGVRRRDEGCNRRISRARRVSAVANSILV
jgi:hypothetical protein